MSDFEYSQTQWDSILEAAGGNGHKLDREALQDMASVLLFHHHQITNAASRRSRKNEIATLEAAQAISRNTEAREQLERELIHRRRVHAKNVEIPSARKPKVCRELLAREALMMWSLIGNGVPGHTNPEGGQPGGPAVRFAQRVVDPAFSSLGGTGGGPLKGTSVAELLSKLKAENAFREIECSSQGSISHRVSLKSRDY
jgi:hypothetical protein